MWRCGRRRSIRNKCSWPEARAAHRHDVERCLSALRAAADRLLNTASSASGEQGLSSLGLAAKAAGSRTSAPYPVTKTKRIFSTSSRSAIAKLFSRTSPTSSSAKSGARSPIIASALATLPAVRTVFTPKPRIMSSKSSAMIGSSSTISTSSGRAASGEMAFHDLADIGSELEIPGHARNEPSP